MKYHKYKDHDQRYVRTEILGIDPNFCAYINLSFPSPSYKYELTDREIQIFAQMFVVRAGQIYNEMITELLEAK